MISLKQKRGDSAEQHALDFLLEAGMKLICKNFSCKFGEIDLIMQADETLIFIEVRYRNTHKFGGAAASVNQQKQRKIIRTAEYYLQKHYRQLPACRLDVVAIDKNQKIDWIKNAIEAAV